MKKTLALLLAMLMVVSLFAGCTQSGNNNTVAGTNPAPTYPPYQEITTKPWDVDYANNKINVGEVTTALGSADGGVVRYDVYAGIAGKDYTDEKYYTLNDYTAGMSNMQWSNPNWETSDDSAILGYISSGFYTFELNADLTGWCITCEMAAELPVDVTADYVGKYGIEEGDSLKAWKIVLNPNAVWEDGTVINADSHIYSYQQLLDPIMKNRRADSLYGGDFQIYGAKDYFYQGQTVKAENILNNNYAVADLVKGDDGNYYTADGAAVYIAVGAPLAEWLGGNTLADYVGTYGDTYFGMDHWEELAAATADDGYAPLNDDTLAWLTDIITANEAWGETAENVPAYLAYDSVYPEYSWDDVGIIKTGEYELVFISTLPTENANYYVPYNLSSTYLVHKDLWESCKTYFADGEQTTADDPDVTSITTNYCTNKETTLSYGPYRLDYFELDKQYNLTRNDTWYGYSDGKHLGQLQTDEIAVQVIADHASAIMAFEQGLIDGVVLQAEDMEKFGSSNYLHYTPESYTTKLTFNTDLDALKGHGTGAEVLANATFREAFSLAIDRNLYCSSLTAGHLPGYGLLNYLYVYDPFTGATYRDTDGAKEALVNLYGMTYGPDGEYSDLNEAYEAITGYDPETAKILMNNAYHECVEAGLYDGKSNITLEICVYNTDEIYVKMFNFLNDALKAVTVGTGFEGKIELKMKADADYYDTMYSGNTDIIFSTWGGAAYSPYSMLDQVYCDASDGSGNQMEFGFDTSKTMVTMKVDGHDVTTDLQTWAAWAGAKDVTITSDDGELTLKRFGEYDAATRSAMFSKLEYAYLAFYATTPIYYRNSVSVYSQKLNYAVDQYTDLVGFGGISFITYNYSDEEWDAIKGTIEY